MVYEWATWLLGALRSDPVVAPRITEVSGWQTRGRPPAQFSFAPSGVIEHHTACFAKDGHDPQTCLNGILNGHSGVPGPISQLLITWTPLGTKWNGKNLDPRVILVAAGRANHAGTGTYSWGAPSGNGSSLGIECCLEEGTPVLTRRGLLPIEKVTTSDEVLTHAGRWKPVLAVHDQGKRETIEIKGIGARPMSTPDHRWMTANGWRRADQLIGEELVGAPSVPAMEIPSVDGFRITPELMRFIGAYVADGCSSILRRKRYGDRAHEMRTEHRLILSPRASKAPIVQAWAEAAGIHVRADHRRSQITRLTVESKALTLFIDEHFGGNALSKTIPAWLLANAEKYGDAFLDGYLHGDGHWMDSRSCWQATTSSRCLSVGVSMLARQLGWSAVVQSRIDDGEKVINGIATKANADRWTVRLYARPVMTRRSSQRVEDGVTYAPVRELIATGVRQVWDITVADDHSFVADGWVTHNCGPVVGWPDQLIEFRERVTAAILRDRSWPVGRVMTHNEYAEPRGRKIDPSGAYRSEPTLGLTQPWNGNVWRLRLQSHLMPKPPEPPPPPPEPPMPDPLTETTGTMWQHPDFENVWLIGAGAAINVSPKVAASLTARGVPTIVEAHHQLLKGCLVQSGLDLTDLVPKGKP